MHFTLERRSCGNCKTRQQALPGLGHRSKTQQPMLLFFSAPTPHGPGLIWDRFVSAVHNARRPGNESPLYIGAIGFCQRAVLFLAAAWDQKGTAPPLSLLSPQPCVLSCHHQSQRREFWPKPLQKIKPKCQVSP